MSRIETKAAVAKTNVSLHLKQQVRFKCKQL